MDSSNRFSVLAEASGSKELKTQVPTGTAGPSDRPPPQSTRSVNSPTDSSKLDQAMSGTEQPGPSTNSGDMSMADLFDTLPPSEAEQVINFNKRGAALDLALEEAEERRKKSRQFDTSTFVGTFRKSAAPVPDSDDGMEEEEFDSRNIINPPRVDRCAFRYQDADGHSTGIIGDMWAPTTKGWSVKVGVDGGRTGRPFVSLLFRVNKGDKTVLLSKSANQTHNFEVIWRAGIEIDGQNAMEKFSFQRVMDSADQKEAPYDSDIVDGCPKAERDNKLNHLAAITIECTSAKVSTIDEAWLEGLEDNIKDGIKKLLLGIGKHTVTIWFLVYPDIPTATKNWAGPLEEMVTGEFKAFWQYRTPDGKPNFSIKELATINEFAKKMYVQYPALKNPDGSKKKNDKGAVMENKDRITGYHHFPKTLNWEVPFEFAVYNIVPVIRGVHFQQGQVAHFGLGSQLIHLQSLPRVPVSTNGKYMLKELAGQYRCYVRQCTKGAAAIPGSTIRLQMDNSNARTGKPHVPSEESKDIWKGVVMKGEEAGCRSTKTDFCVWLTKPQGAAHPRTHKTADYQPDEKLLRVHIEVIIDETSANREILGMAKLAEASTAAGPLGPIRMALMSDYSKMRHTKEDLTAANTDEWKGWEKRCAVHYKDNPAQLAAINTLKSVENKLTACIGPPGTGKTKVLTDVTIGGVLCGHRTMVCAVTNNATDKAANSVWEAFPSQERSKCKMLRYETNSAEMKALITRTHVSNPDAGDDPNARPTYKPASTVEDDDVIRRTMAECASLQGQHEKRFAALWQTLKDTRRALAQKHDLDARKESNVPTAMTLPNRMYELSFKDQRDAADNLDAELKAYRADKLEPAALEARRSSRTYQTEAELVALGEDKLDEEEIAARLGDGRIPSAASRDPSIEYRSLLNNYILQGGNVSRNTLLKFEDLRIKLLKRVLGETDVLFVTCNNAGSDVIKAGFSPNVINIDETGQLTIAAFANVLTSFPNLRAANLWGDIAQLMPFLFDPLANEFSENALLSVLALLEEKDYPILRLTIQYRMAPAIVQWPSKYFYKGSLQNHPKVIADSDFRKVARDIAKTEYGIAGPDGTGSEYWMIDVVNGVSRVQNNGTSLQNHASADRIATLVDQTLSRGVDPSKITVLTYYTGQLSLVGQKIKETVKGKAWEMSASYHLSSVDSFQGEENEFVFLDIVVAKDSLRQTAPDDDEVSDDGLDEFRVPGRVTAHVKSPNRLCCALTRGRSCVVVIAQLNALIQTAKPGMSRNAGSIAALGKDLIDRNLVFHDRVSIDTSPIAEEERKTIGEAKAQEEFRLRQALSRDVLSTFKRKGVEVATYAKQSDKPVKELYRTSSRRTTRPNQSGAVVNAAEKFDSRLLNTEAGAIPFGVAGPSQRPKKNLKKAEAERRKAAKEADEGKPKGRGQAGTEEAGAGEGKGKGKGPEGGKDKMDET